MHSLDHLYCVSVIYVSVIQPNVLLNELLRIERPVYRIMCLSHSSFCSLVISAVSSCQELFNSVNSDEPRPLRNYFLWRPGSEIPMRAHSQLRLPFARAVRFQKSFTNYCR